MAANRKQTAPAANEEAEVEIIPPPAKKNAPVAKKAAPAPVAKAKPAPVAKAAPAPVKKAAVAKKPAPAAEPETEDGEVTREALEAVATSMNDVMGLKPEIDITADDKDLTAEILKNSADILPDDEFSDENKATLAALGVSFPTEPVAQPLKKAVQKAAAVKAQAIAKAHAAAKPKAPAAPKYTRFTAFGEAFKAGNRTIDELVKASDDLYVQNGGKSNPKEAVTVCRMGLGIVAGLGLE